MTHEEVKRIINSDLVNYDELTEARKIATECIDKQIPKKPTRVAIHPELNANECLVCGQEFGFNTGIKYCDNCGQRLDWSDAE